MPLSPPFEESGVRLTPTEYQQMLTEIGQIALMLGRTLETAPQDALPLSPDANALPDATVAPLARLRLLVTLWPEIQTTLQAICRTPDTQVALVQQERPLERLHGDPTTVQALARTPAGQAIWKALREGSGSALPATTLPERRAISTRDTPTNRFLAAVLRRIEREGEVLATLAQACEEENDAQAIQHVVDAARRQRLTTFLRELPTPATVVLSSETLATLLSLPAYRHLVSLWNQIHCALAFDWAGTPRLRLPARERWQLYEIWCFLTTAATLTALGWRLREGDALRWGPDGLRLALKTGRASRLHFLPPAPSVARKRKSGALLTLEYQPYFPSANQVATSDSTHALVVSRTHVMQPDIGLLWQGRYYLLDAKFRSYTEPEEAQTDLDKMHTYRDAIVCQGRSVVEAAWCLFPGGLTPQETILAYPTSTPEQPFGTAGIGAIRLRPGEERETLRRLLIAWLG